MKKHIVSSTLAIAAILFAAANLKATATEEPPDRNQWVPAITLNSYVANQYLAFGTGVVLSTSPVIQTNLNLTFPNGVYVNLWASQSTKGNWNNASNLGDEIDYGIGWKGSISKHLTLDFGFGYFDEPRLGTFGGGDILYTHVFLTRAFKHFAVTAGFENYIAMPKSGFKGGNLISIGIGKDWSFLNDKIGAHASVAGVYDTGTPGARPGFFIRGNAGADWNVTKRFTLNVIGLNWFLPAASHGTETDAMLWSGATIKF